MSQAARPPTVQLALLWHMHQPSYRDPESGEFAMPWVRLHALKDYFGMVQLLSEVPEVRLTFNLVPSLLDQVLAYADGTAREALLAACERPARELLEQDKLLALRWMFMAHPTLIGRLPRFAELLALRGEGNDPGSLRAALPRFAEQDYRDLQVLSRLAWFDLEWQARDAATRALIDKGRGYTEEDKQRLRERERALLQAIVPAYREAAERGQVELSTTPYYHPILPLLCDTAAHNEAHPAAALPRRYRHPEDAADQIRRAVERHQALFGARPLGLWPSEGSVSDEAVAAIAAAGFAWTASDEGVLERSAGRPIHRDANGTAQPLEVLYRPWSRATPAGELRLLFRDRALSDLIGFSYASLAPERAAADMLARLVRIGERWRDERLPGNPVVPVILDGENCWEHYGDGGRVFLRELYRGLQEDPRLRAVAMSEAAQAQPAGELARVFAGSWINADFSVWIGHPDDRRAWDLLSDARDALERARQEGALSAERLGRATEIFRAACGSDWCWWYGEDHSSENDAEFDRLFRRHLIALYRELGATAPDALEETLITARRAPQAGTSAPTGPVRPSLDGRLTTPEEWKGAGVHRPAQVGAMHRGQPELLALRFGIGDGKLHVLLEASAPALALLETGELLLCFQAAPGLRYRVRALEGRSEIRRSERLGVGWVASPTWAAAAAGDVLEVAIPLAELESDGARALSFRVLQVQGGVELARHPEGGPIELGLGEVMA
jgi:alpha-amylase/alpha-mannosidase (GH57 family)